MASHSIPSPLQSPESRRAAPPVAAEEVGDVLLGGDWVAHRPHHRPERPEVPSMPPSSHRGGSPASPQSEDSLADPYWRGGGSFSLRQMKKRPNGKARLWAPQRGRRWSPEVGRKNAGWLPIGLEPTPLSRRGLPARSVPPQPQVKSQCRCCPPPSRALRLGGTRRHGPAGRPRPCPASPGPVGAPAGTPVRLKGGMHMRTEDVWHRVPLDGSTDLPDKKRQLFD